MLRELTHAQEAALGVVRSVGDDDWCRPTRCEGWVVADVVRHLVVGDRAFAVLLGGTPYDLEAITAEVDAVPVERLVREHQRGVAGFRQAFNNATEVAYPTEPLGPMSAQVIAALRASEAIVHGWDVADATGQADRLVRSVDPGLVEALQQASHNLMERMPDDRRPFAPPRPVDPDAPALERYVAYLGRDVAAVPAHGS